MLVSAADVSASLLLLAIRTFISAAVAQPLVQLNLPLILGVVLLLRLLRHGLALRHVGLL